MMPKDEKAARMAATTVGRRVLGQIGLEVRVLGSGGCEIGYVRAAPEAVARLLDRARNAATVEVVHNGAAFDPELGLLSAL